MNLTEDETRPTEDKPLAPPAGRDARWRDVPDDVDTINIIEVMKLGRTRRDY